MPEPAGTSVAVEHITQAIRVLHGRRVLLDSELAALYGVATKRLNEQVKRNLSPGRLRLSAAEIEVLNRSQNATASHKHRDPRFRPYAFTEHGAIMAAMVLNSQRATEISIYVVRAFVKLRGAARVLTTKSRPTAAHGSPVRPMSLSSLA